MLALRQAGVRGVTLLRGPVASYAVLALALVTYAVLLGLIVPRHEPWFDEAHAWLVARDSTPIGLFTHWIRYEGQPGLWHLVLLIPAQLHLPYVSMGVISAVVGLGATAILLLFSPFPLPLRVLIPFSYWIFYQYPVVARNYILMALVLFAMAALYPKRMSPPQSYAFVALAAVLANTSAFGALIATAIYALYVLDVLRGQGPRALTKKPQLLCGAVFALALAAVYAQVHPYKDLNFGIDPPNWDLNHLQATATWMLDGAFTEQPAISFGALTASLVWFWRTRTLLVYLVPTLAVLVFLGVKYSSPHHQGILFLIWLFALWVSLERRSVAEPALQKLPAIAIVAVLLFQLPWSYHSYKYDYTHNFSGAKDAANYIKTTHLGNARIDTGRPATVDSIQPYFDHNIFHNYGADQAKVAFNIWTKRPVAFYGYQQIIGDHPDLIVYWTPHTASEQAPHYDGYVLAHVAEGSIYWKNRVQANESFLMFRRVAP